LGRVMKEYSERRAELSDAAWELFSEKGYDGTTINAIIDRVGVAKGTFYHYFSSKEDILNAAVERKTVEVMDGTRAILEDENLSATEKLNRFMAAFREWKMANMGALVDVARVMYRDENIVLRHKINMKTAAITAPVLADIIAQGVEEGVFDTEFPRETAELILAVGNALGEMNMKTLFEIQEHPEKAALIQRRANLYFNTVERMLGAPKGSMGTVETEFIESLSRTIGAVRDG